MNEFGEYLKQLRGKRYFREMERITGLSHTYLSTLEKGYDPRTKKPRHPTPESLKKLSETLEVDYNILLEKAGYIDKTPSNVELNEFINNMEENSYLTEQVKGTLIDNINEAVINNVDHQIIEGLIKELKKVNQIELNNRNSVNNFIKKKAKRDFRILLNIIF